MTTPTPTEEPKAISEEVFDGPAPQQTVHLHWDVDNGKDRFIDVPLNSSFPLQGNPMIQGIDIKGPTVTLYGWANISHDGNPTLTVEGPTDGMMKVDPKRRIESFRVKPRW